MSRKTFHLQILVKLNGYSQTVRNGLLSRLLRTKMTQVSVKSIQVFWSKLFMARQASTKTHNNTLSESRSTPSKKTGLIQSSLKLAKKTTINKLTSITTLLSSTLTWTSQEKTNLEWKWSTLFSPSANKCFIQLSWDQWVVQLGLPLLQLWQSWVWDILLLIE